MKKVFLFTILILLISSSLSLAQKKNQKKNQKEEIKNNLIYFSNKINNSKEPTEEEIKDLRIVRFRFDDYMKYILWNESTQNLPNYSREKMKKLGYEFVGINTTSYGYIVTYRNCTKGMVLEITNLGRVVALNLQWYEKSKRKSIAILFSCQ